MDFQSKNKAVFDRVINILTDGSDDTEKSQNLRLLANEKGIDLEEESIDGWLDITILYSDGLDGLVSSEEDYLNDLDELSTETSLTKEYLNDEIIFGGCSEAVNYESGFYSGGVTVYHYQQLCHFLNHRHNIDNFENALRELRITQKIFCERVGVSEQAVSKWKKTQFPKWVWYALKGMK